MTPPRVLPGPRTVQLKQIVDIQLDRCFHEQQWSIVANLARQRYKSTKDEYYKAVEIAAKSRSDNPTELMAGREAVHAMVDDNVIVKDADALDLYEFAVDGLAMDYAKTIGVLRARLAKALPKDRYAGLKCLEACMWNSDWENAQEIAVSLNKNFPGDRNLLFQNIVATFLVATADDTNENKKKLFPNLAKAQVDRAFNLRPLTGKEQTPPDQLSISENEIKLWIKIRERFGSSQENLKLLSLPNWGPLFFLERAYTDVFLRSIRLLTANGQWEEITRVVNIIFDKVIAMGHQKADGEDDGDGSSTVFQQQDSTTNLTPGATLEKAVKEQYMKASREWFIWRSAFDAAGNLPNREKALEVFHKKIQKVFRVHISNYSVNPVFQQNYDQIMLDITFARATSSFNGELRGANKVECLLNFAKKNLKASSCFTTLKGYLEVLSKEEIAEFVDTLGKDDAEDTEKPDFFDKLCLIALRMRAWFFQATSLEVGEVCRVCHSVTNEFPECEACLTKITEIALGAFSAGVQDEDVAQKAAGETEDPLSNLALLGSICLIKLAGVGYKNSQHGTEAPLYGIDIQLFLQGVIWLDFYLRKAPKNDSLRMLLVKLYLMMGCVTRALEIWGSFDIKNTLLECLGTICLDRLASISPSHFTTGTSYTRTFAEPYIRHFETALQKRYPDIVTKTLENGSYAELPNVIELAQNQSRNCVIVLAVVEHRRGLRLKAGKIETPIQEEPLISSLSLDYELKDLTDYSPLPHWAGPQFTPIQELASYGPLPTNRRCHLSILAERFIDLISYVQAKEFKPSKAVQLLHADLQAAASSCVDLHRSLEALISGEGHNENNLTGPETWYFRTVTELSKLVKLVIWTVVPAPLAKIAKEEILATTRRILTLIDYQTQDFLATPDDMPGKMYTLHGVASLHSMGMLRESAFAIKATVQYISAALDRAKAAEKSRSTTENAWLSTETKKFSLAAAAADVHMKDRIKKLAESLHAPGWVDCLEGWALGDNTMLDADLAKFKGMVAGNLALFVPAEAREVWAMDIADSWRDVVKGWGAIRF
ncbi:N-acetyltransferase B complex non catalytic subunit-domain-containing protein, partial [Xylaria digitata]